MDLNRTRTIGDRIRTTRERHQMTLLDVSERSDGLFSASRLANFEQGIRRPEVEDALALAAVFGDTSPAWLLTLDQAESRASD